MAGDELLEALGFRRAKHVRRRTFFFDHSLMQEDDAVRDVAGETHLVSDDQHGAAFFGECPHDPQNFPDQLRIERRVGSSKSITCGRMASARAMAARCCCPPERCDGYWLRLSTMPTF